jgi:3-hydroxyacyl-CoA dehydrogenase / enoyl-CoA hydratase / 3-hydroxybutyryl-CoA epimerase
VLIDATQEAADRGKAHSEGLLDKGMKRGKVTAEKKAEVLGRITATTDYAALAGCDLIVEAVFEDPKVKAEVTAKVEAGDPGRTHLRHQHLDPADQRSGEGQSKRPEQFIGIHFFSPVDKMMLVEIIRGKETGDRGRGQGAGFRAPDPQDADRRERRAVLLRQPLHHPLHQRRHPHGGRGVEPALVENAAKLVGMPLGPLQLVDETSIDLGVKIAKATKAAMGDAYPDGAVDEVLFWMADRGGWAQGQGGLLRL